MSKAEYNIHINRTPIADCDIQGNHLYIPDRQKKLARIADLIRAELGYDTVQIVGMNGPTSHSALSCAKTDYNPKLRHLIRLQTRDNGGRFMKL